MAITNVSLGSIDRTGIVYTEAAYPLLFDDAHQLANRIAQKTLADLGVTDIYFTNPPLGSATVQLCFIVKNDYEALKRFKGSFYQHTQLGSSRGLMPQSFSASDDSGFAVIIDFDLAPTETKEQKIEEAANGVVDLLRSAQKHQRASHGAGGYIPTLLGAVLLAAATGVAGTFFYMNSQYNAQLAERDATITDLRAQIQKQAATLALLQDPKYQQAAADKKFIQDTVDNAQCFVVKTPSNVEQIIACNPTQRSNLTQAQELERKESQLLLQSRVCIISQVQPENLPRAIFEKHPLRFSCTEKPTSGSNNNKQSSSLSNIFTLASQQTELPLTLLNAPSRSSRRFSMG
ncbi:MAG: hypothetical protein ACOYK8_09600 [Alphaproteobacteria bacterium]